MSRHANEFLRIARHKLMVAVYVSAATWQGIDGSDVKIKSVYSPPAHGQSLKVNSALQATNSDIYASTTDGQVFRFTKNVNEKWTPERIQHLKDVRKLALSSATQRKFVIVASGAQQVRSYEQAAIHLVNCSFAEWVATQNELVVDIDSDNNQSTVAIAILKRNEVGISSRIVVCQCTDLASQLDVTLPNFIVSAVTHRQLRGECLVAGRDTSGQAVIIRCGGRESKYYELYRSSARSIGQLSVSPKQGVALFSFSSVKGEGYTYIDLIRGDIIKEVCLLGQSVIAVSASDEVDSVQGNVIVSSDTLKLSDGIREISVDRRQIDTENVFSATFCLHANQWLVVTNNHAVEIWKVVN